MPRRAAAPPPEPPDAPEPSVPDDEAAGARAAVPDLRSLPIAGIGRRQVGMILGAVLAVWVIGLFARQVGDASAASTRAETIAAANEELRHEVASYRHELAFIQRQEYVVQQARGYGLGKAREIPFTLAPDAPPLPDDAPGSASVRVGAPAEPTSPLDSWLELLFGPG
jgi:cell division protein FtsB